jgi:hypothetical protein
VRDEREELQKRLDEVVGTAYDDERGKRWRLHWLRASLPRWILAVVLAIGMVSLIWLVLDRHLKAAHRAPDAPRGPVIINIVPTR